MEHEKICATCWHVRVIRPEAHRYIPTSLRKVILRIRRYCMNTKSQYCNMEVDTHNTCLLHKYNPFNSYERDYRTGKRKVPRKVISKEDRDKARKEHWGI